MNSTTVVLAREKPMPLIGQLILYVIFALTCISIMVAVLYMSIPFNPYEIGGYASVPRVVCPNDPITIRVKDALRQQPNIEMRQGSVIIYSQLVGVGNEPAWPELPFPVEVEPGEEWSALSEGGRTQFARSAPQYPGEYTLRSRVEVTGHVFGRLPKTLKYRVPYEEKVLAVRDYSHPLCAHIGKPSGLVGSQ